MRWQYAQDKGYVPPKGAWPNVSNIMLQRRDTTKVATK